MYLEKSHILINISFTLITKKNITISLISRLIRLTKLILINIHETESDYFGIKLTLISVI